MNAGIGEGKTRADHRGVADQISALLGRGHELRGLVPIVGEQSLSDDDRRVLAFVDDVQRRFVGQGGERRSIEHTLDLAWRFLAGFPARDLSRIAPEHVDRYHDEASDS
jgi:V/A-type H+/Na+-transporting ATPase subunit B